jgi:hypothetical protein
MFTLLKSNLSTEVAGLVPATDEVGAVSCSAVSDEASAASLGEIVRLIRVLWWRCGIVCLREPPPSGITAVSRWGHPLDQTQ